MTKSEARQYARGVWRTFLVSGDGPTRLVGLLRAWLESRRPPRILAYAPLTDEIDPWPALVAIPARLYAPRTLADSIEFREYRPGGGELAQIMPGFLGVPGPGPAAPRLTSPLGRDDLVIVPTRAANPAGVRLGRGGGYYDRALPDLGGALRLGLLPEALTRLDFPGESHDLRLDIIVTERAARNA